MSEVKPPLHPGVDPSSASCSHLLWALFAGLYLGFPSSAGTHSAVLLQFCSTWRGSADCLWPLPGFREPELMAAAWCYRGYAP